MFVNELKMWGLILTLVIILVVIGLLVLVIYALHQREQMTITEDSGYSVDFSINEAQLFENFKTQVMRDIACKSSMTNEEFAEFVKGKLPENERRKLKALLIKRLISCIEPLKKIKADRQGIPALAEKKLISDEYFASFSQAERTLNEEIELILEQSDLLEPGWNKTIFNQAVQFWRLEIEKQKMMAAAAAASHAK